MSTPGGRAPLVGNREVRHDITFSILRGPWVRGNDGEEFVPDRAKISWWDGKKPRACVVITGRTRRYFAPYPATATFNLHSYSRRRPCPPWLLSLCRQVGYTGWATNLGPRMEGDLDV
jgi:hypothetical protein